jgi:uncharacterized protein DUF5916/cellulose/xylan binding protein with CBM9 domain
MMPRPFRLGARSCAVLAIAGASSQIARAGDPGKSLVAARTLKPPKIDGRIDDAVWGQAQPDDRFTQRFPRDGATPVHRTTVRVLYDDAAVYVGMRMDDDEADKIVARLARRDHLVESDFVTIALDSRHDHSSGFFFTLNAAGVQFDGTLFEDSSMTYDWDAVWEGVVSRDSGGWSAEFKIPLSVLRFPDTNVQEWGIQAERYVSRTQEDDRWSYTPQDVQAIVSPLGHLTGLDGLHPRRTLELLPFTVARLKIHSDAGGVLGLGASGAQFTPEAIFGLDAKIGLTSNLTLDATVQPDFGQVDADEVVLNLSRFETFFPEKRPFFLEGGDLFRTDLGQFYSRRIGRGLTLPPMFVDDGKLVTAREPPQPVAIRAAIKVTGKLGEDVSVGVLDAVTASEEVIAAESNPSEHVLHTVRFVPYMNYAVLRARYAVRGASYVGFLATAATRLDGHWRGAGEDHDGYSQGVDGAWQSDDSRWRVTGDAAISERVGGTSDQTPDGLPCPQPHTTDTTGCIPLSRPDGTLQRPGDVGWGALSSITRTGVHWDMAVDLRALSPTLDLNDLGFQPSFDVYDANVSLIYQQREPRGPVQNYYLGAGLAEQMTFDNVVTGQNVALFGSLRFTNFWSLIANAGFGPSGRWNVFETGDGARLQRPSGVSSALSLQSDPRSKTQFSSTLSWTRALGRAGWSTNGQAQLTFNVIPTLQLDLSSQLSLTNRTTRLWFPDGCRDDAGEPCTPLSVTRHYILGDLDSGSLSFTSHAAYTFSPNLSLQGYAQLFMARGEFVNYASLDTTGIHPRLRLTDLHPKLHLADLPLDLARQQAGDSDGDGDFQQVALNVNLVLRWEFTPGSALLLVYSRAQSGDAGLDGRSPRFTPGGLSGGPTEDVFLMKLSYFAR